jgi:hypothetical protein
MNAKDKIKEEIEYWELQEQEARQNLRAAENILPSLRETLSRLSQEEVSIAPRAIDSSSPIHDSTVELSGSIPERIYQLLESYGSLTVPQIVKRLAEHGKAYPRPSVDAAVRRMVASKRVVRRKAPPGKRASFIFRLAKVENANEGGAE